MSHENPFSAIFARCVGAGEFKLLKLLPLYPANRCHDNCASYCAKTKGFTHERGWLLVYDAEQAGLLYHSVVRNEAGTFIDITKRDARIGEDLPFILDLAPDARKAKENFIIDFTERTAYTYRSPSEVERAKMDLTQASVALRAKPVFTF